MKNLQETAAWVNDIVAHALETEKKTTIEALSFYSQKIKEIEDKKDISLQCSNRLSGVWW